jgi:hypothetical protein
MAEQDPNVNEALDGLDPKKRETLTRLLSGSAFVAPIVASFAMQGVSIRPAEAQPSSSASNSTISDGRLKKEVVRVADHPRGFGIYEFKYLWSDKVHVGVLAEEVAERAPEAVRSGPGGFLVVDYPAIGMEMIERPFHAS